MRKLDVLTQARTLERQFTAEACAAGILTEAKSCGIEMTVVGSMARGEFRLHSDVDLAVHGNVLPVEIRVTVERLVARHMRENDIPYDILYEANIGSGRFREILHDV